MAEISNHKKLVLSIAIGMLILGGALYWALSVQGSPRPEAKGLESDVSVIAKSCESLNNREQCYAKAFENLTKATDRDYAFAVLRALQQKDPQARGCHF